MTAYLTWDSGNGQLFWDCTTEERIESTLLVSDHPVEDGPDVSDNAKMELEKFGLRIFVSNVPFLDPNGWRGGTTSSTVTVPDTPTAGLAAVGGAIKGLFGGALSQKLTVVQWNSNVDAVQTTLQLLQWLQTSKKLLTVYTSKRTYQNCLLTKVGMRRSAGEGTGGAFELDFKQLRLVTLAFTNSPEPTQPRGQPAVVKGAKGSVESPPKRSLFVAGGQGLGILGPTPVPGN